MYTIKHIQPYKHKPLPQDTRHKPHTPTKKEAQNEGWRPKEAFSKQQTSKKKHKTSFPADKRGENDKKLVS